MSPAYDPHRPLSAEELEALVARLRRGELGPVTGPFEALVGYRVGHDPEHGTYLELEIAEQHLSHYGIAHGGVTLVLLDTVGGVACFFRTPGLHRIATISLACNFVRAVERGRVVATARLVHVGGSVAHVTMSLHERDFDGPLLATGSAAYRLFRARP